MPAMRKATSLTGWAIIALLLVLQGSLTLAQRKPTTWTIPPEAKTAKTTLKPSPDVLKRARATFERRCVRCHGPEGLGNGVDARPDQPPANLTASKAAENPDGVLYYKIWNGQPPKMPAFKTLLKRDDVWAVVEYVKSLRKE
jgi:mono/diheme cytochrome c family protein